MKLHLPSRLRKALLACLAALALPTAGISTTIASASGIAAAFAALQAQVEAAPDTTAQKTQDVSDRSGIGIDDQVTYSGWIFSMNVGESTPEGSQSQPLYGGQSGNTNDSVHVKYYHWLPNEESTGMEYSTTADGTAESWNGRQGPASGPDGKNSKPLWTFFDSDGSGSASINHTLRLEGGNASKIYNITSDFHSAAYSLCFGGLIVEAGQGGFTVGGTARPEKIVLKTGTAEGVNFEALILSDFAFTTRNKADNLAVSVESNANFRVGTDITMDFGRWVKVAENQSLNLSRVGAVGAEGSAIVSMGRGLDLASHSSLVVGAGVKLTIDGDLTVGEGSSLSLADGSHLILGGALSTLTSLDLTSGGQVTLTHGKLTIQGQVNTDADHRLDIVYSAINSAQLHLSEGWSGDLYLTLTDFTDAALTYGYALFDAATWDTSWAGRIHITSPEGSNWELDSYGRLVIQGSDLPPYGWPSDSEFPGDPKDVDVNNGATLNESGTLTYTGEFKDNKSNTVTVTLQGGDGDGINVKITAQDTLTSDFNAGTLSLSGHIKSLMFTDGQFRYAMPWEGTETATIDDIYVKGAMLFLDTGMTLRTNVHVGGKAKENPQAYEGTLRVRSNTVTLTGDLVAEADTIVSVQGSGKLTVQGRLLSPNSGANLSFGTYEGGTVELLGGGSLTGTLGFVGTGSDGSASLGLTLGKAADADQALTLTVQGLTATGMDGNKKGYIIAGGEGAGYAELVLNGSGTYTFNGMIGTSAAAEGVTTGWTDTNSKLNLTISGAQQTLSGSVHVHDLTIEAGSLTIPNSGNPFCIQVDGNLSISGKGTFTNNNNTASGSCLIVKGNLILNSTASGNVFHTEGAASAHNTTLIVEGELQGTQGDFLTNGMIVLKRGGELNGNLAVGWGGGITLGGDLAVGGDLTHNNESYGQRLKRLDGVTDTVFLLRKVTGAQPTTMTTTDFLNWFTTGWAEDDGIGEGIGFGKAGDGALTLTGTGDWTLTRSLKVEGGGTLEVGSEDQKVNMRLTQLKDGENNVLENNALIVDNANLVVHGSASVEDYGSMRIYGGGSLKADAIERGGHAGTVILGDDSGEAESSGTLTVEEDGVTKVWAMAVHGSGSSANLGGNLSIWNSHNGYALDVDGGQVTVGGSFYADNAGQAKGTVRVHNNGQFTVNGDSALFQTLNVDGGTVEVTKLLGVNAGGSLNIINGGSVTAGRIRHINDSGHAQVVNVGDAQSSGTLILTGSESGDTLRTSNLNVQGEHSSVTVTGETNVYEGMSVGGGTVELTGNLTVGQTMTVTGGDVTITGNARITGATLVSGGSSLTVGTLNGSTVTVGADGETGNQSSLVVKKGGTLTTLTLADGAEVTLGDDEAEAPVESTITNLTVGGNGVLEIKGGNTLTVSDSMIDGGDGGSTYGNIIGDGTLKLTAATGSYAGRLTVANFTYAGSGTYSLTGLVDVASLTVQSGTLTFGGDFSSSGNDTSITVDNGATLVLGYASTEGTNYLANTVLTVNGNLNLSGGTDSGEATYVVKGLKGDVSGSQVKIASSSGTEDVLVIDTDGIEEEELSFSGEFKVNGSKKVHLVKRGEGTQILTTSSLDTASTTVEGGTLRFTAEGKTWSNFTVRNGAEAVFERDWKFDPTSSVITVNGGSLTVKGTVEGVNSSTKPAAGTFKLGTVDGDGGVASTLTITGAAKIKSLEMYRGSTANFENNLAITGGNMTVNGGTLTVTGALTTGEHDLNITGGEVTLNGGLTAGTVNVSGGEHSSLNINNGGTLTALALADGAEVTLGGSSSLTLNTLQLVDGTSTLTLKVTESNKPSLSISTVLIGTPVPGSLIALADAASPELVIKVDVDNTTHLANYNPFGDNDLSESVVNALKAQNIVWEFVSGGQEVEGYEVLVNEEGKATVMAVGDVELTWNATEGASTLTWDTNVGRWTNQSARFENDNNVTLTSAVDAATVTVVDGIAAGTVSVGAEDAATTWTFGIQGTFEATEFTVAAGDTVTMKTANGGDAESHTVTLGGLTLGEGSRFNTAAGSAGPFDSFTVNGTIIGQGSGDTRSAVTFNNTNVVFGDELVIDGANVTLTGTSSSLEGAGVDGHLTLQNSATLTIQQLNDASQQDTKSHLGTVTIDGTSKLVIADGDNWDTTTTVQGAGTMVWQNLGSIGGSGVTLAEYLLKGETLGRLELEGTQLYATDDNAENLAKVETVALTDETSTFTVGGNLTKGDVDNTLEVTTTGRADAAIIWSEGTHDLAWDISADGNLSVQAAATGSSFSGTLKGTEGTEDALQLTITQGNLTLKNGFAIGSGTWIVATDGGAGLTLDTTLGEGALQNATVNLGTNGTLTLQGEAATVGTLSGEAGTSSVDGAGKKLTVGGGIFAGTVTLGELALGGESFSLTATEGSSVTTLNVDTHTLTLGGELSVQNLAGDGSITAAPEGGATLKIDGNSWSESKTFNGTVSTNLEFTSNSRTNSLTIAKFSDGSVTVNGNGKLIILGAAEGGETLTLKGSATSVAAGATLVLGGVSDGNAHNVTIDGDIALSGTLNLTGASGSKSITGTLTLSDRGASVDWTGDLAVGKLAGVSGADLAVLGGADLTLTGDGTEFANILSLGTGTLSTEGTGTHTLSGQVTATGGVDVGANTTLNLGENYSLGDSNTVNGTLSVAGGTLNGVSGDGTVSVAGEMMTFTTAADGFKGTLNLTDTGVVTAEENLTLGALTGEGALTLEDEQTLTLTGATGASEFSGTLSETGANLSYSGQDGQTQSFTQETNWDNLTLTGAGTLSLNGGTVQTLAGTSIGKLTVGEAGLEIGEWASGASLSSLTLNGDLTVGEGVVDVRTVTGSGKLLMDLSDEPGVTFAHAMKDMTGTLAIELSGLKGILESPEKTYKLFGDATGLNLREGMFNFTLSGEFEGWKVTVDSDTGELAFSVNGPLTWDGSGDSFVWNATGTSNDDGWSAHYASFSDSQDVVLKGQGTGGVTVTLSGGEMHTHNLTIGEADGPTTYTFTGTAEGTNSLHVAGDLTLNDNAEFAVGTTVVGKVTGDGTLTLSGGNGVEYAFGILSGGVSVTGEGEGNAFTVAGFESYAGTISGVNMSFDGDADSTFGGSFSGGTLAVRGTGPLTIQSMDKSVTASSTNIEGGLVVETAAGDNGNARVNLGEVTLSGTGSLTVSGAAEMSQLTGNDATSSIGGTGTLTLQGESSSTFAGTLGADAADALTLSVNLTGADASLTLTGSVGPEAGAGNSSITVNSGTLNLGAFEQGSVNTITLKTLTIGENATVDVYTSGTKNIGHIVLSEETSTLVIHGAAAAGTTKDAWAGGGYASGTGTIKLLGLGEYAVGFGPGTLGDRNGLIFWDLVSADVNAEHAIGKIVIGSDGDTASEVKFNGDMNGNAGAHLMENVKELWVESGSTINICAIHAFEKSQSWTNTLHLTGSGYGNAGALQVTYGGQANIAWDIVTKGATTIKVGGQVALFTGKLTAEKDAEDNNTITKLGKGTMLLTGTFSTEGDGGTLDVAEGTLKLDYTTGTALTGYGIKLADGTTLTLGADSDTYEIAWLADSAVAGGTIDGSGKTLKITGEDNHSSAATVSGGVSVTMSGTGTQSITGTFGGADITVSGGELVLGATNAIVHATGNVTLDGTLTLGSESNTIDGTMSGESGSLKLSFGAEGASLSVGAMDGSFTLQNANGEALGNGDLSSLTITAGAADVAQVTYEGNLTVGTLTMNATTGTNVQKLSGDVTASTTAVTSGNLIVGAENKTVSLGAVTVGGTLTVGGNVTAGSLSGTGTIDGTGMLVLSDPTASASFAGTVNSGFTYAGRAEYALTQAFGGGALAVQGGKLTLASVTEGLTSLELGDEGTGANLAVNSGDLTLAGTGVLNLTNENTLTLTTIQGGDAQKLVLGEGASVTGEGTLKLALTKVMLGEAKSKTIQLVSGMKADYLDQILVSLTDDADHAFGRVALNEQGYLIWGDDTALVWGQTGDGGTWADNTAFEADGDVFTTGTFVVFDGEVADVDKSVTIGDGGVTTGKMTVTSGEDWTFSGGALTVNGTLTVGSTDPESGTVTAAADVTFDNASVSFGSVVINDGSSVTLDTVTAFTATDGVTVKAGGEFVVNKTVYDAYSTGAVSGAGSIVLQGLEGNTTTPGAFTGGTANGSNGLVGMLNGDGVTIGSIVLREGVLATQTGDAAAVFNKATSVVVESGATLKLSDRVTDSFGTADGGRTLYLRGALAGEDLTPAVLYAAGSAAHTIAWDVSLGEGEGATIQTDAGLTISGGLKLAGKTLTKTGGQNLTITGDVTNGGVISVNAGTVIFNHAQEEGNKTVNLGGVILDVSGGNVQFQNSAGTMTAATGTEYVIGGLTGSGGNVGSSNTHWLTIAIDYSGEEVLEAGVNISDSGSHCYNSLVKRGSGTQKITGSGGSPWFVVNALTVEGGTLEITEAIDKIKTYKSVSVQAGEEQEEAVLMAKNWEATNLNNGSDDLPAATVMVGMGGKIALTGSYTGSLAFTVQNGGQVTIEGTYGGAGVNNGGDVTLSSGGTMTVGGTFKSGTVSLTDADSVLTLSDAGAASETDSTAGTLTVGENATVKVGANRSLTVTTLSGAGSITGTANGMGTLVLANTATPTEAIGTAISTNLKFTGANATLSNYTGTNVEVASANTLTLTTALGDAENKAAVTLTQGTLVLTSGGTIGTLDVDADGAPHALELDANSAIDAMSGTLSALTLKGNLTLGASEFSFGDVDLGGSNRTLSFEAGVKDALSGTKITLTRLEGSTEMIELNLSDELLDAVADTNGGSWDLFDATGVEGFDSRVYLGDHTLRNGYELYMEHGTLYYQKATGALVWNGTTPGWEEEGDEQDWNVGNHGAKSTFEPDRDVVFNDVGIGNSQVGFSGTLNVANMTVENTGADHYSFTGEGNAELHVAETLTLNNSASFDGTVTANALAGAGTLELAGGTMTLATGGTIGGLNLSGEGAQLTINGGTLSTGTLEGAATSSITGGGTLTVTGATINYAGSISSNLEYNVQDDVEVSTFTLGSYGSEEVSGGNISMTDNESTLTIEHGMYANELAVGSGATITTLALNGSKNTVNNVTISKNGKIVLGEGADLKVTGTWTTAASGDRSSVKAAAGATASLSFENASEVSFGSELGADGDGELTLNVVGNTRLKLTGGVGGGGVSYAISGGQANLLMAADKGAELKEFNLPMLRGVGKVTLTVSSGTP